MTTTPQQTTQPRDGTHAKPYETTIRYWQDGDEWVATEKGTQSDIHGRGDTPAEAIAHYGDLLDDVLFGDIESGAQEVPADD